LDPQALENLLELQDVLNILFASELRFEAHYWGSYAFFEAPQHQKGLLPIAHSIGEVKEHFLIYDALRKGFYIPYKTHLCIARQLKEFIDLPQPGAAYTRGQHFDKRLTLTDLLPESDYIVSTLRRADVFEFTEPYEVLLQLAVQLSGGSFQPESISAIQLPGNKREIKLQLEDRVHSIRLGGKTFDNEFLHGLNLFLIDAGVKDYKFAATINRDGFFTLLKLKSEQFQDLASKGMLA